MVWSSSAPNSEVAMVRSKIVAMLWYGHNRLPAMAQVHFREMSRVGPRVPSWLAGNVHVTMRLSWSSLMCDLVVLINSSTVVRN
jgi:hypothetical protein